MDFPPSRSTPPAFFGGWVVAGVVLLLLGLYAAFLGRYIGAVAGGSDSSGYLNHARLLAAGRNYAPPRAIPGLPAPTAPEFLYAPLGFKPIGGRRDRLVPTYPTGLPLLILAVAPVVGWAQAGNVVLIGHALAGLVLTWLLGRTLGLGARWAAVGAVAIAASPLYLFMAQQAMSDVPALVWTTVAVIAAWRSRQRTGWAALAGAAMALDVLVRPSNALAFLPIAVALGGAWRRWLWFALAGLPGAVFFLAYSRAAYGGFLMTGYGDASQEFLREYIPGTLLHYVHWLPLLLSPLAVLAAGLPLVLRRAPRAAVLLGVWILVYLGFYSAYVCTHQTWWYLRFLLPAAPAIVVGGLLVARQLAGGWIARLPVPAAYAVWLGALALVVANGAWWTHSLHALSIGRGERKYAEVAAWLKGRVPPDAVLLTMQASGALFYYTDYAIARWDSVEGPEAAAVDAKIRQSGRPYYAVLFPFELDDALIQHFPGEWSPVGKVDDVTIWRREPGPAPR
jgi:hypothetical protein